MSLDLLLGLIGTLTGVISIILHILRVRQEKPHVEVIDELLTLQYEYETFHIHGHLSSLARIP